ncbi:MAG: cell division protein SepF [Oscillospiraceae bacterium]|nr:cell division protein SepF [Eubacteriales bacterium]MDY2618108.1 cell division protein SepF [Oscillospiraceae bacterium]
MSGFAFWRSQDYAEDERYDEEEEQRYEPVSRQEEIAYRTPKDSGDARTIADDVKSGTTVIFHVDALDAELTLRVLDYLSGVAYCTSSEIRRIAVSTYLITPPTVQVIQMRCD